MTLRLPIWLKILGWFFLNLLLLLVVFSAFFRLQFRLGLDSLLSGPAGDRVQLIGSDVGYELAEAARSDWNSILERHGEGYGVTFRIYRPDGEQIAGDPLQLPEEVVDRIVGPRGQGPGPRNGQSPGDPRAIGDGDGPRPGPGPPGGPPGGPPRNVSPRFMLRTDGPRQYWVGIRLPAAELLRPGLRGPINDGPRGRGSGPVLVMSSASFTGGGLFFDVKPWAMVVAVVVVVSVLFWLPMMRGMTRSIARIDRATLRIAEGDFTVRVDEARRDDLGRLGGSINQLASRLDGFVAGQKRFLGDIAHELCSPLARMQMALGILEQRADEKQQGYVEDVREEVQHMSALVAELLSFSKAGLRSGELALKPVPLRELVERVVARETSPSDAVEIEIAAELAVLADEDLLARAVGNVVRNAIRYAGGAGPVALRAVGSGAEIVLTVRDSGPGVPEDSLAKLFDPFFRPDVSRTADTGGVGLGLAIVKTCVEACQGRVSLGNLQPHGLEVEIRLPAAQ
jgi:two-component system, OmpR family, sensor histidine kinase CpxA